MPRRLATLLFAAWLGGCATLDSGDPANLAAYCTAETAFRIGSQGRAYFDVCPKESEAAFLAGLQRGRQYLPLVPQAYPYYVQMEALEKQLMAAGGDTERKQLREQLARAEWWAMELIRNPGTPTP
jgi:hypothetical protein